MKLLLVIYVIGVLFSLVLSPGWDYALWQRKYPALAKEQKYSDRRFTLSISLLWYIPLSWLGLAFAYTWNEKAKYGWMWIGD